MPPTSWRFCQCSSLGLHRTAPSGSWCDRLPAHAGLGPAPALIPARDKFGAGKRAGGAAQRQAAPAASAAALAAARYWKEQQEDESEQGKAFFMALLHLPLGSHANSALKFTCANSHCKHCYCAVIITGLVRATFSNLKGSSEGTTSLPDDAISAHTCRLCRGLCDVKQDAHSCTSDIS